MIWVLLTIIALGIIHIGMKLDEISQQIHDIFARKEYQEEDIWNK